MTHITDQQIEQLLERVAKARAPVMPLRKQALKHVLTRRIVARQSPYVTTLKILVPALLVLMLVFWGKGRSFPESGELYSFINTSSSVVSNLSPEEKQDIVNVAGFDPAGVIEEIQASYDARFIEGIISADKTLRDENMPAVSTMMIETEQMPESNARAVLLLPEDDNVDSPSSDVSEYVPIGAGESPEAPMMLRSVAPDSPVQNLPSFVSSSSEDATSSVNIAESVNSAAPPLLAPVVFVQFTDASGNLIQVGFDERSVPVTREVVSPQ